MARYLDPKADLTFKKVFAEHKNLMISFLNALLMLEEDEVIVNIDIIPFEKAPENPLGRYTVVNVSCKNILGYGARHETSKYFQCQEDEGFGITNRNNSSSNRVV